MANTIFKFVRSSTRGDWLGVCASIICAVHCAAMPFIVSYLPALGLSFLADEFFHKVMVFVCFSIAIYAFIPGLKQHRKWAPMAFGTVGLMFISVAAFGVEDDCCAVIDDNADIPACCASDCEEENISNTEFSAMSVDGGDPTKAQDLLSKLGLWITPIGGAFLVVGHLLNKRFGSNCHCCPADNTK